MRGWSISHVEAFVRTSVIDGIGLAGFRDDGRVCCVNEIFGIGFDVFTKGFVLLVSIMTVAGVLFESSLLGNCGFFFLVIFERSLRTARAA